MGGIFMGNNDIAVSISSRTSYKYGYLNKCLIITDDAEVPFTKLDGATADTALAKLLETQGVKSEKLTKAINLVISQVDNSGITITPEYVYIIGKKIEEGTATYSELFEAIEEVTRANDFYCLVPLFEDVSFNEWFVIYGNSKKKTAITYTTEKLKAFLANQKPNRMYCMYDGQSSGEVEFKNVALAARVMMYDSLIAYKWKTLAGVTTDEISDTEVSTMAALGINGYREVRSLGETTGSRAMSNTADTDVFFDEIIIKDNIIYNVAVGLNTMFKSNEIVPMGNVGSSLVLNAISSALAACGDDGLIEPYENGSYKYSVSIPTITANMRSVRELSGVTFKYLPTIPVEAITVKGTELLEWVEESES